MHLPNPGGAPSRNDVATREGMMQPVPPQATSRDWLEAEYKDPYAEVDDLQLHSDTHSCLGFSSTTTTLYFFLRPHDQS